MRLRRIVLLVLTCPIWLAACTSDGTAGAPAATEPSTSPPTTTAVPATQPDLKVAWINRGQSASEGWTAAHAAAADEVAATFDGRVDVRFVETVEPGTAAEQQIDELVADGFGLIVATSADLEADMVAAARRHPQVRFEQARGRSVLPNLGTFGGADEEPIYLAGMAAASQEHGGVIGFVGTVPEPETIRHINAFTLGARSIDPEVVVEVRWMRSWFDPAGEERLARELLDQGAGVLATGSISPLVGRVASEAQVGWVGHDVDWSTTHPDVWLTGAVPDWAPFYEATVRAVLDGSWTPDAYYGAMDDGYTDVAPIGARVGPPVRAQIEDRRRALLAGRFDVFAGPIRDQRGVERVGEGGSLDPAEAQRWDWFVEGVRGEPR